MLLTDVPPLVACNLLMPRIADLGDRQAVGHIINHRVVKGSVCDSVEPKGSALGGVNVVFAYKLSMRREFDDFTGMKNIGV